MRRRKRIFNRGLEGATGTDSLGPGFGELTGWAARSPWQPASFQVGDHVREGARG